MIQTGPWHGRRMSRDAINGELRDDVARRKAEMPDEIG